MGEHDPLTFESESDQTSREANLQEMQKTDSGQLCQPA